MACPIPQGGHKYYVCAVGADQLTRIWCVTLKKVNFKLHDYSIGISSKV